MKKPYNNYQNKGTKFKITKFLLKLQLMTKSPTFTFMQCKTRGNLVDKYRPFWDHISIWS